MNPSSMNGTRGTMDHLRHAALPVVALLACVTAIGPLAAADIEYTYDELGRLVRVFDPAGADITYDYDKAGNVTGRTVIYDTDKDGDPNASDCDSEDPTVFSGAPEINDGIDNQCPGDFGYGVLDEVEGGAFTDKTTFTWTAQPGATTYEVAWSTAADFSSNCAQRYEITAQSTPSVSPAPGEVYFFLVRAVVPNAGSWGLGNGIERTVPCAVP